MTPEGAFDSETEALVALAAAVAVGDEPMVGDRARGVLSAGTPRLWVEELLLQSILMVGYPRALVATGIWRRVSGSAAPGKDGERDVGTDADGEGRGREGVESAEDWVAAGEEVCRTIYGDNYDRLRENIQALHPVLDEWMITDGYGRVLSRPGLDLPRRELCIIAQLAVLQSPRQLHSHLRGALNVGALPSDIDSVLRTVQGDLSGEAGASATEIWRRIRPDVEGRR